ncbi:hypothetical protein XH86_12235 [Bradyrhizobium guangdongense]|uniref:Uncharacterized protein n=1 Tax=Bradyrhizobium guangdongense TaxID=1325090 RepID=A0ABX6UDM2_9BRAD|nr:hypothetical protein X265_12235 [Bradyrhizobium guangdongense]QOZ59412.1 hypothetical protein XH86_12235 [Bradyrhizobium guangdongense]
MLRIFLKFEDADSLRRSHSYGVYPQTVLADRRVGVCPRARRRRNSGYFSIAALDHTFEGMSNQQISSETIRRKEQFHPSRRASRGLFE